MKNSFIFLKKQINFYKAISFRFNRQIPTLKDFIKSNNIENKTNPTFESLSSSDIVPHTVSDFKDDIDLYSKTNDLLNNKMFFIETLGCQMNENDSDIIKSILTKSGLKQTDSKSDADVILLNTCAIRLKMDLSFLLFTILKYILLISCNYSNLYFELYCSLLSLQS